MIALFGGTFNPVHNGHISLAQQVAKQFDLQSIQLLPSFIPVHRELPEITPQQRLQMLSLAIQGNEKLRLNDAEIKRAGPSYSFDTLTELKKQQPDQSICWLMGADSFNSFNSWKNPSGILKLCNLIVCARPGIKVDNSIYTKYFLQPGEKLVDFNAGKIALFEMQPNNCSSSTIRKQLKKSKPPTACLSQPVLEFIQQNNLYEN